MLLLNLSCLPPLVFISPPPCALRWVETKSGETEEYALATTFEDDGENKVLSPKFGGDNHFAIQAKFSLPEGR